MIPTGPRSMSTVPATCRRGRAAPPRERSRPRQLAALLELADDQPRGLIGTPCDPSFRQGIRVLQDRRMGQRLYGCHAYECRELQVDSSYLRAVSLEVGSERRIVLAAEGFHVLQPSGARYLLR